MVNLILKNIDKIYMLTYMLGLFPSLLFSLKHVACHVFRREMRNQRTHSLNLNLVIDP